MCVWEIIKFILKNNIKLKKKKKLIKLNTNLLRNDIINSFNEKKKYWKTLKIDLKLSSLPIAISKRKMS